MGAGDDLVSIGEFGYNESGGSGIYAEGNDFKYKYEYSYIWFDTTKILYSVFGQTFSSLAGYYESQIQVTSTSGAFLILNLLGSWGITSGPEPFTYSFAIDNYYTSPISYHQIKDCNLCTNAFEIASISYLSTKHKAKITIASDPGGLFTDFSFKAKAGTETFGFSLAFQQTLPEWALFEVSETNEFTSEAIPQHSPIGNEETTTHRLEGKIKLYTEANEPTPVSGVYSSTIYVIITQVT